MADPPEEFMDFSMDELRAVGGRLIQDMPGVHARAKDGLDKDLQTMLAHQGGWNIANVLQTAAACAVAKQLPADPADVQFVRGALENYGYRTVF